MTHRKSIARRTPIVVYRVEHDEDDPATINVRAWIGDEMGRMIRDRFVGKARVTEYTGPKVRGVWIDNRDTDAIHNFPESVRECIWRFDDVIREAIKKA